VIVGGMSLGTLLTIFVVPTMYMLFAPARKCPAPTRPLLHPGRLTEFRGTACDVQALADHVGIRQNTVIWAEVLEWGWPEGGPARWNARYWINGTPKLRTPLHKALNDMFFEQGKYEIGCYAATKVVFAQGALDYFRRVKMDAGRARHVEQRLLADGEPLVDLEPGRMWSFETDFDPLELERPGKVLRMVGGVAAGNFVPGDWAYFLNTDPRTSQRDGVRGLQCHLPGRQPV
jgi:hypothetical protein